MSEWKEYIVENLIRDKIISVGDGYRAKNIELDTTGIPFARAGNIDNGFDFKKADFFPIENLHKVGNKKSQAGDIVFTSKGTVGRFAFVTEKAQEFVYSPQLCYWRSHDQGRLHSRYLYYWMHSREFLDQVHSVKGQTDMADYVSLFDQRKMKISIPTIEHQLETASVLSSLDDKIDLLHRQNKTLEAMAETLFRQWFVEEAEESWEEKSLTNFIATTLGGEWGKENPEGEYVIETQCIRGTDIADLETGIPLRTPTRFIKQRKFESIEIQDGDLVMEISGGTDNQSTGRTTYINRDVKSFFPNHLIFSNFCRLIRPKKAEFSFFLYSFIHYLYKQGELFNLENGSSGIKNLNYKALLFDLKFRLPDEEKIIKYNIDVSNYFNKINKNKIQVLTLMKLRDGLLPKLMSGEVKITYK